MSVCWSIGWSVGPSWFPKKAGKDVVGKRLYDLRSICLETLSISTTEFCYYNKGLLTSLVEALIQRECTIIGIIQKPESWRKGAYGIRSKEVMYVFTLNNKHFLVPFKVTDYSVCLSVITVSFLRFYRSSENFFIEVKKRNFYEVTCCY